MVFLLNILFGILGGALANYVLGEAQVKNPVRIILAVIIGLIVFLLNLARFVLANGQGV